MSSLSFVSLSWSSITDKVSINWQNSTRVRLQLKFAFKIRPLRKLYLLKLLYQNALIYRKYYQQIYLPNKRVPPKKKIKSKNLTKN